jgi:GNAT superfamily N-acetyltransferase
MANHDVYGRKIAVRRMTPDDRPAVLSLVRELQAHELSVFDRMIRPQDITDSYLDHLDEDCATYDGVVLVAVEGWRVTGYASLMRRAFAESYDEVHYTYAYIGDLVVTHDARGQGIGRALIEACEAEARASGAKWLRISVLAKNAAAHALYRSAGFADHLVTLEKPIEGGG